MIFIVMLTSCSWVRKQGVNFTTPVLEKGASQVNEIQDWDYFQKATPGSILLLESLLATSPQNPELLSQIIKAHFGYAYGVYETEYLGEYYRGVRHSSYKNKALYHYKKAIEYGKQLLEAYDVPYDNLKKLILAPPKILERLDERMTSKAVLGIFYTGAALSSSINLQRTRGDLITLVPLGKALIDWACEQDPDLEYGFCQIFDGMYLLSRPKMFGGNPSKGLKLMQSYAQKNPGNFLIPVTLLQFHTIPTDNKKEFNKSVSLLSQKFKNFEDNSIDFSGKSKPVGPSYFNLFNAIAKKRFENIVKNKKHLF